MALSRREEWSTKTMRPPVERAKNTLLAGLHLLRRATPMPTSFLLQQRVGSDGDIAVIQAQQGNHACERPSLPLHLRSGVRKLTPSTGPIARGAPFHFRGNDAIDKFLTCETMHFRPGCNPARILLQDHSS